MSNRIKIVARPADQRLIDVLNELDGYVQIVEDEAGRWNLTSNIERNMYSNFGGYEWREIATYSSHASVDEILAILADGLSGKPLRCGRVFRRKYLDLTNTKVVLS